MTTKPFFREAFKRTRCLISASGYYEGQDTLEGKQPHYFTRTDGQVISLAGLWDRQTSEAAISMVVVFQPCARPLQQVAAPSLFQNAPS